MALILDVGMYDGTDTAYYLSMGFRVLAVEANPALVAQAAERFEREIRDGRLTILHRAGEIPVSMNFIGHLVVIP